MCHQLEEQHDNMLAVLTMRKTRVRAAKTQWDKDINGMVDYLLRMEDETLTVDLLPMLTLIVKVGKVYGQHGKAGVPSLSMGACLELLPLLHPLLESIYDRYLLTAMDFLLAVVKHWWKDLQVLSSGTNQTSLGMSRSTPGVYTSLVAMTDKINTFVQQPSAVGNKAKALSTLLLQLQ